MTWTVLVISFIINSYGTFTNKEECLAAAQDLKNQGVKATCIQIDKAK